MTVQDAVRTATLTSPPAPADPPPAPLPPAAAAGAEAPAAPLLGRERPLTADEGQFCVALAVLFGALMLLIVPGLLLAQYAVS